jgi:hypothetical protein
LLALLIAQAGAGLHALQHFGKQGDPLGLPGQHAALCLECALYAPVGTAHVGGLAAFSLPAVLADPPLPTVATATSAGPRHAPFHARAPPR